MQASLSQKMLSFIWHHVIKTAKQLAPEIKPDWSWAGMGSGVCGVQMPQEHVGEIGCAGGQPWEKQFGGFNPSLAGRV